jgi:hypothetical protein
MEIVQRGLLQVGSVGEGALQQQPGGVCVAGRQQLAGLEGLGQRAHGIATHTAGR